MPASCPPRRSGRGSDSAAKAQRHGCPAQGCGLRRATAGARTPALARQSWAACPVRWRRPVPGWYARIVTPIPVLGGELAGPWFRVQSIVVRRSAASAEHDFLDVLPAASAAASAGRPLVAGWLCRAAGAPLEFITNAALPGPESEPGNGCALPGPEPGNGRALLFPPGAKGVPAAGWTTACEALVWAPCPGRHALPLLSQPGPAPAPEQEARQPGRFESALAAARGRPSGWLVVAEPTGLLGAEEARLRAQVAVLCQHDEERLRSGTEKAAHRLAELDAFREAGLWAVRVLVGAATPDELARLAPVLAGSAGLGHHPYRLGTALESQPLAAVL